MFLSGYYYGEIWRRWIRVEDEGFLAPNFKVIQPVTRQAQTPNGSHKISKIHSLKWHKLRKYVVEIN